MSTHSLRLDAGGSENLISEDEIHYYSGDVDEDHSFFVPKYAPFFADEFIMKKRNPNGTWSLMVLDDDYSFGNKFEEISLYTASTIYGTVLLSNAFIGFNTFKIESYRTLGGSCSGNNSSVVREALALIKKPAKIEWGNVTPFKKELPPKPHLIPANTILEHNATITLLNTVAEGDKPGTNLQAMQTLIANL